MVVNWAGANCSLTSWVLVKPGEATDSAKRLASVGRWLPNLSRVRSSGTRRWLMRSRPTGCSTWSVSDGSSWRSETRRFEPGGNSARQLLCLPNSAVSNGITATGGRAVSRLAPQVKSMLTSIEKNRSEIEAVPEACHGVGPSRVSEIPMLNRLEPNTCTANEVEMLTEKWNGENWIAPSKLHVASTDT